MNCYRFPDRKTFRTLAAAKGLVNLSGQLISCSHAHAIDEVGIITRGGAWDPETGEELEPPTVLDGWHVNTIGISPPEWEEFRVTPEHPVRVFAGCE